MAVLLLDFQEDLEAAWSTLLVGRRRGRRCIDYLWGKVDQAVKVATGAVMVAGLAGLVG